MTQDKNLRKSLYSALSLLAIGPLIMAGLSVAWFSYEVQSQHAVNLQHELSKQATDRINGTITEIQSGLESIVNIPGFFKLDSKRQEGLLALFRRHTDRRHSNTISEVILLNKQGHQVTRVSRNSVYADSDLEDDSQSLQYKTPIQTEEVFFSPVWFDQQTGDPLMTMSVPLRDVLTADIESIVVLQLRLKELWDVVTSLPVGTGGSAYIITENGRVVAHATPSIVLRETRFPLPTFNGLQNGLHGEKAILTTTTVSLGDQQLHIITELPALEAFGPTFSTFAAIGLFTIVGLILSGYLWFLMVKKIARPIESLTNTAIDIRNGDLSQRVLIGNNEKGLHEIQFLASSFNEMLEQLQSREQSLEHARWAAETAARAKSTFLATMSHEIRTPLNGVLGMAQVLDATQLDDEQRDYLNIINQSGETLVVLLNEILDFSRIEADKIKLEPTAFSLEELSQEVQRLLAPDASNKGIKLISNYGANCPINLIADIGRLRQILLNLLSNAVKFTTTGHVIIDITGTERSNGQAEIHIEVQDTGPGIAPETQKVIFDAFTQADGSHTRSFGGAGLGLAITKRLVNLMGGTIGVKSSPGKGSTFWIDVALPLAESGGQASHSNQQLPNRATTDQDTAPPASSQLLRFEGQILLVEDNASNQLLAKSFLKQLGFEAILASNGKEAIEKLQHSSCNLIIMDCQMPEMDGYQATQIIRSQGCDIPIIAFTANAMPYDRQRCLDAGMNDYIAKPLKREALVSVLSRWLPENIVSTNDVLASARQQAE